MTLKTRRRHNVSIWSENRRRKHNVVTTLDFGWSNDVGNSVVITLLRRCPTSRPEEPKTNVVTMTYAIHVYILVVFWLRHRAVLSQRCASDVVAPIQNRTLLHICILYICILYICCYKYVFRRHFLSTVCILYLGFIK